MLSSIQCLHANHLPQLIWKPIPHTRPDCSYMGVDQHRKAKRIGNALTGRIYKYAGRMTKTNLPSLTPHQWSSMLTLLQHHCFVHEESRSAVSLQVTRVDNWSSKNKKGKNSRNTHHKHKIRKVKTLCTVPSDDLKQCLWKRKWYQHSVEDLDTIWVGETWFSLSRMFFPKKTLPKPVTVAASDSWTNTYLIYIYDT